MTVPNFKIGLMYTMTFAQKMCTRSIISLRLPDDEMTQDVDMNGAPTIGWKRACRSWERRRAKPQCLWLAGPDGDRTNSASLRG